MGAYSRWVLILGWAPIRINTVNIEFCLQKLCQAVHWMLKITKGLSLTMNIWECLKIQILIIIKSKLSDHWILTSLEEISKMKFSVVLTFRHINFLLAALDNNK